MQVQHQYCLTDEQGPAHRKVFFVKLKLGDEEFDASGASIKKAQHAAAATALESTKLPRPPPKRLSTNAAIPVCSLCLLLLLLADHIATGVIMSSVCNYVILCILVLRVNLEGYKLYPCVPSGEVPNNFFIFRHLPLDVLFSH